MELEGVACQSMWQLLLPETEVSSRQPVGIEPRTSRALSENQATKLKGRGDLSRA